MKLLIRACNVDPHFISPGGDVNEGYGKSLSNVAGVQAGSESCPWIGMGGVVDKTQTENITATLGVGGEAGGFLGLEGGE